jgi:N-dimethylarginine dimethylaminohydrolase
VPPSHDEVSYAINPWMDVTRGADRELALRQWETLRRTYLDLGHEVEVIAAEPGLPDMVFAANGGLVIEGRALGARFTHAERRAEGPAYLAWLAGAGLKDVTEPGAHTEAQELFGIPVVSLQLVDPRFYHLDTALAVFDDSTVAYYPEAFSPGSRGVLQRLFPDAVLASEAEQLRPRGYEPVGVDLSELLKAGGSAKCATLEVRPLTLGQR